MRISKLFLNDNFILALILLNAVVLFVGGYFPSDMGRLILSIADNTITVLFVVELVVKFNKFGARGYLSSGWNRFDFILILLSLPALITFIFNINSGDISFLLVFRVMRVFKSFRFFKFIPNFNQIVSGLQRALKTSVFVLLGFLIYIFIIGVLSFYLFKDSGTDYFRDPVISLYSTFKIFTVEGWFEIPERLTEHYSRIQSFFTYFYFIFIVLTGGIFGLSIVNSIFVDAMVSDNNDELEKKIDSIDSKINEIMTKINNNETRKNT